MADSKKSIIVAALTALAALATAVTAYVETTSTRTSAAKDSATQEVWIQDTFKALQDDLHEMDKEIVKLSMRIEYLEKQRPQPTGSGSSLYLDLVEEPPPPPPPPPPPAQEAMPPKPKMSDPRVQKALKARKGSW